MTKLGCSFDQSIPLFKVDSASNGGSHFLLKRSNAPEDIFHFKAKYIFGNHIADDFSGELRAQKKLDDNSLIYVIPSQKLNDLDKEALDMICPKNNHEVGTVITDSGLDCEKFMHTVKNLTQKSLQRQNVDDDHAVDKVRFFICENADDSEKLLSIVSVDS